MNFISTESDLILGKGATSRHVGVMTSEILLLSQTLSWAFQCATSLVPYKTIINIDACLEFYRGAAEAEKGLATRTNVIFYTVNGEAAIHGWCNDPEGEQGREHLERQSRKGWGPYYVDGAADGLRMHVFGSSRGGQGAEWKGLRNPTTAICCVKLWLSKAWNWGRKMKKRSC